MKKTHGILVTYLGISWVTLGCNPIGDGVLNNNDRLLGKGTPLLRQLSQMDPYTEQDLEDRLGLKAMAKNYRRKYDESLDGVEQELNGDRDSPRSFSASYFALLVDDQRIGKWDDEVRQDMKKWLFGEQEQRLWICQIELLEALLEYGDSLPEEYNRKKT